MIGTTISHYKIIEKLGEGGMGIVYKAEDTTLKRIVALKFLPEHVSASETDKARFLLEAQAAAALNHPNICTIYGIEETDGKIFIAMEFIDGQTLNLKRDSVNLHKAIDIGIQIADGLAAAHEKGIVHRDIKPENIMVRKDGIAQIMDFGLAKLRASRASRLTKEGSTVGTAGFMSPEQIQGQDTDHRSDIFSLGVLLYELLTGELPFKGVHETALLYEIVNVDPVPMSTVKSEIDPELDRIILECLQKDPEERYQSVKEISRDLKRFKRESSKARVSRVISTHSMQKAPIPAEKNEATKPAPKRFPLLWIAGAFLAGAALTVLFWQPWVSKEPPLSLNLRLTTKLSDNISMPIGTAGVNISPDGKFISLLAQDGLGSRFYLRPTDREVYEAIGGSEVAAGLVSYTGFSPDGKWVAFNPGNSIKKASVFGGASVTVCNVGTQLRGLSWGSDKRIYFGTINNAILYVNEDGGTPVPVTTLDSTAGEISHRFPELLPDGKNVLYTVKFNNITTFEEAAIAVCNINTGERKIIIRGGSYARYTPTGHLVYARGSYIFAVPFDLKSLEVTGAPKQLFKGGWMNPFSGEVSLAFSNNGTLIYIPRGIESYTVSQIKWIDRQGLVTSLVDSMNSYFIAALSPDQEKIALHVQAANDDVWLYHTKRQSLTRLTFGGGNSGFPIWSHDGNYVIYMSETGKGSNIYRKSWDGSGKAERLTQSDHTQYPRSVSPDGKILTFNQDGDIWLLEMDGSGKTTPFIESSAAEQNPVFSPDGKYITYESNESGKNEIYVVSYPSKSGKWQISAGGGTNPFWSPAGGELFYTQGTSFVRVSIRNGSQFDYSAPQKLFTLPPDGASINDVSSDGQRFVMITIPFTELSASEITLVTNWFQELNNAFAVK